MVKLAALAAVVLGLSLVGLAHTTNERPAVRVASPVATADIRVLEGECTKTTSYGDSGTATKDERVKLSVRLDDAKGPRATVLVTDPWSGVPADLWRGWCHVARNDGQPQGEPCPVAPFELTTDALGMNDGYSFLRFQDDQLWLTFNATVELGRDSLYDKSFSDVRYTCSLQETATSAFARQ